MLYSVNDRPQSFQMVVKRVFGDNKLTKQNQPSTDGSSKILIVFSGT
jgi:hypothetical protein